MTNHQLQALLGNNVLELTFVRRHPKLGWSNVRGLLGTTNFPILNDEFGKQVLRFSPPLGVGMGYDYRSKNLCVVWDIFRQEYRVFGAEQVNIRKVFDATSEDKRKEFEKYFYDSIMTLSDNERLEFMGYLGDAEYNRQIIASKRQFQDKMSQLYQNYYKNSIGEIK